MLCHVEMVKAVRTKILADSQRMADDRLTPIERVRMLVATADDPEQAFKDAKIAEYQRVMFEHLGSLKD